MNAIEKKPLVADWESLQRIFIKPENEATRAALLKYMEQILFGLHDFLREHVGITEEASLLELSEKFQSSRISANPSMRLAEVIRYLIEDIAPHAVNVASPYFIGHMTTAIPFFMIHLQTIMAALHQNPVKLETSKVVSVHERQVLAKIHREIYGFDDAFYDRHIQNPDSTLGSFVDDGTLANLTAFWVARNACFPEKEGFQSVEIDGMAAAMKVHGYDRCVILVSRLGHYSIRKAGGILGIGNRNVIAIDLNPEGKIDTRCLEQTIQDLQRSREKTKIISIVGIAGATETGAIDPLDDLADICQRNRIHFHVDAAWGGPTRLSDKYRSLLDGIERADTVTIDGHKQFYMPMGCGMVYFRDPAAMDRIAYHARYVNRPGSVDLGIRSLEGSRAAVSLVLGAALEIMGRNGYSLLVEHGIETAREMAEEIRRRPLFQLMTDAELNILTYRLAPPDLLEQHRKAREPQTRHEIAYRIDEINILLQRLQREAGQSFVSRTTLQTEKSETAVVLRCVIMNPMTDIRVLRDILDEQEAIYRDQIVPRRPK